MKLNVSVSMPYEMSGTYKPPWAKNKTTNASQLKLFNSLNPEVEFIYKPGETGYEVQHVEFDGNDFYYVEVGGLIQYCVEVEALHLKDLSIQTLFQTSVWLNNEFYPLAGLAKRIFYKFLYPKNHNILSDNMQSKEGRRFWAHRINESIEEGRHLYVLKITGTITLKVEQVVPILSPEDAFSYYTKGKDKSGLMYRFLIIDKPVTLTA